MFARWPVIAVSLWITTAPGPGTRPSPQIEVPTDSQAVVETARDAQRRFEQTRRRHLPWGSPSYGRCDVRIGRFCLTNIDWSDSDDLIETSEHPAIDSARVQLLALLDSAARIIPGDAWIAGQRVRYLVEAGKTEAALEAASACRAQQWWCRALEGFVYYADQQFAESESAFAQALASMDEERRCEWTDLSRILDGDLRDHYRDLQCTERQRLERRILWLADPLYSIPGNELLAEHYARHVHSGLLEDAESPEGDRWGQDLHRIVLRYGWSYGWERIRSSSPSQLRPSIRGHLAHGAKYFLPDARMVDDPLGVERVDWDLEPHLPRAGHAPPYAAKGFDSLAHRVAAFRRGNTMVVATTFELTDATIPPDASVQAALVFAENEDAAPLVTKTTIRGKSGTLVTTVPYRPLLMSYEVLAVQQRRAARARYGIGPATLFARAQPPETDADEADTMALRPSGEVPPTLSRLLITEVHDSLPETLDAAIDAARPGISMRPGERFGLYWEFYGSGPAVRRVSTSLVLAKRGKSFLKRLVGVFGFGSDDPPVSLEWRDTTLPGRAVHPRAVAVDLPDDIPNGTYELRLELELEDGSRLVHARRIEVTSASQP